MRSRILQYKNNLANYDLLTQFSIKNYNSMPTFSFLTIQIKNARFDDARQICLSLISIQLIVNNYVVYNGFKNIFSFTLKLSNFNTYFILENLSLIAYKNQLTNFSICKGNANQNKSMIKGKNFLSIVEYFLSDSNLLKILEKMANKDLSITFAYQIINSKNVNTSLYLVRSLGLPFSTV